jgi:hypothetical protein
MNVYKLTIEQKDLLVGQIWCYDGDGNPVYFNPQPDADGELYISIEEVQGCTLQQAITIGCDSWLLSLPLIHYNPIIIER